MKTNQQTNSDYIVAMANLWERRLSTNQHIEPEDRTDESKVEGKED